MKSDAIQIFYLLSDFAYDFRLSRSNDTISVKSESDERIRLRIGWKIASERKRGRAELLAFSAKRIQDIYILFNKKSPKVHNLYPDQIEFSIWSCSILLWMRLIMSHMSQYVYSSWIPIVWTKIHYWTKINYRQYSHYFD